MSLDIARDKLDTRAQHILPDLHPSLSHLHLFLAYYNVSQKGNADN